MKENKKLTFALSLLLIATLCTGCSMPYFKHLKNELIGSITGNTYHISFYTNEGENYMNAQGQKITMEPNIVEEQIYTDGGWGYTQSVSSVMTILVDGKEIESCGSTILFAEDGLTPDVDFKSPEFIDSNTNGALTDNTLLAKPINHYKNYFGKSRVVVVQSQLGNPICAYSGEKIYWEVCEDLPKTTKLMIDGKALYIHRANFNIIDTALLN